MSKKTVGFVGIGRMGRPMALRVMGAGFPVRAFDVRPEALEELSRAGAHRAASAGDAAAGSEVVITILPDAAAVEAAILGEGGIASGIRPGAVLVEMSTISPSLARRLAAAVEGLGAHYLDCPVSGGVPGAERGTLTLLAGGSPEALRQCREALQPMAGAIYHLGGVGSGLAGKLVNQLLNQTQTVLVVEALALAARAGLDLGTLYEVIRASTGASWCWENRVPRILKDPEETWVTLDICRKDLGLARSLGEELGIPLFVAAGAYEVFQMAEARDLGKKDVSALARMYEETLGVKLRPPQEG